MLHPEHVSKYLTTRKDNKRYIHHDTDSDIIESSLKEKI